MARRCYLFGGLSLLVFLTPLFARAENVVEGYRSPFGALGSPSVNLTDGSAWVAAGSSVMHVASDGEVLSQTNGFKPFASVSVYPTDGSCWVADGPANQLIRLAANGKEVQRISTLSDPVGGSWGIDVNPADGSLWVIGSHWVVHLAPDGTELGRGGWVMAGHVASISVYPEDGSFWAVARYLNSDVGYVSHCAEDGTELWRSAEFASPSSATVDPNDGSCWITNSETGEVIHLAPSGAEILRTSGYSRPRSLVVNTADSSCWFIEGTANAVVHIARDGVELWRGAFNSQRSSLSVNSSDGSVWITQPSGGQLVHISAGGTELWRGGEFIMPSAVAANSTGGSAWVGDYDYINAWVTHLSRDGTVQWRNGGFQYVMLAANPTDGSCWIADPPGNQVAHWAADGTELWRSGEFDGPGPVAVDEVSGYCWVVDANHHQIVRVSDTGADLAVPGVLWIGSLDVNQVDGSLWFVDYGLKQVVHTGADGKELWRGDFPAPSMLAVGGADGSCWLIDDYQLARLDASGTEVWRGDTFYDPSAASLSVNHADGTLWVADTTNSQVVHVAGDGAELWRGGTFSKPRSVSVDSATGSVWVADTMNGQVVRFDLPDWRPPRFRDVPFDHWAWAQVEACALAGIVAGYSDGTYRPSQTVTRAQMAVYVSRALTGSDAAVPTGPAGPSFPDVDTDHWAYKYIEYAHALGIVEGYGGGGSPPMYRPDLDLDRGQMAVFIARSIATPTGEEGMKSYTPPATPTFPDVPTSFWAYKYVEYIAQPAIAVTQGYPDGLYHPEYACTRDQMAVYVARAFQLPT